MEAEKAELKSILRGLLISSPRQMTVRDLQNDFARQEGREFPFQKFGFRNFVDYLKTIKDTVVLSGSQPIYVTPVVKANTAHVNEMVLRQKNSAPKKTTLKALEKSRRRGWVPIVIPPDPPKALPTLLSIRVPSRNKNSSDTLPNKPVTFPSSSFKEPDKAKAETQHKMMNGPNSCHNDEGNKSGNKTLEQLAEDHKVGTKSPLVNGPYKHSEGVDSFSDQQPEKWKDISKVSNDEMKGHDDTLFKKYCFQNISFRSINNIEEWYHTETPQSFQHSVSPTTAEIEQSHIGNNSVNCETVSNIVSTSVASKFKEENKSGISCEENSEISCEENSEISCEEKSEISCKEKSEISCEKKSEISCEEKSEINCQKKNFNVERQETCSNLETSTSLSSSLPSDKNYVNSLDESVQSRLLSDKTVQNMKKLIKENPQGLWASEFPAIYKECYGVSLDYRLCGYMSMVAVAASYPDVFIFLKRSSADYLLLDADKPLPKYYAQSENTSSYAVVPEGLKNNIMCVVATFPTGLQTERFKEMYKLYFTEDLNEKDVGFSTVDELLQNLHEEYVIRLRRVGKKTLIYPARNPDESLLDPPLPSFKIEDDSTEVLLSYPPDVFDSKDTIPRVSFPNADDGVPVLVSDVNSPSHFHMVLLEYKAKLDALMDELQAFYTTETEATYKMPESAIRPGVMCVARYMRTDWHRAEICSIKGGMRKIKVRFIDYGTVDIVDAKELRFMHSDFAKCPVQAITGSLANIEPINGLQWEREASTCLLQLVKDKVVIAVMDQVNEVVSVALVDTTGDDDVHINDELVGRGYAKFKYDPLSAADQAQHKIGLSNELQCNGMDINKWIQHEKVYGVTNCLKVDNFALPHCETVTKSDAWTPTDDDKKKNTMNVTGDLKSSVKTYLHSVTKCGTSNLLSGVPICDNFSPNLPHDITSLNSYDHKSSESDVLLSKSNITQVWGTPFVMSTPVSSSTGVSNEADSSLKLKEIPDTWNVPTSSTSPLTDAHPKGAGYSEPDSSTLRMVFNEQLKNSVSSKAKESSQHPQLTLPGMAILPKKHSSTNHFEIPHSSTELSRNCFNSTAVQSQACVPNLWNLGNISVNASWPPPVNNPAVYNPSTPMWQQQSSWYQPHQTIHQYPLNSFGVVSAVPPPGFTSIQNPFVTYSTSPFPTLNPQLSLLTDPFVYQQRNKSWPASVSGGSSGIYSTASSSPTGLFTNQCSSAHELKSTQSIPEISEVRNGHSMLKKIRNEQRSPKYELDSGVQSSENRSDVHHTKNGNVKAVPNNQDSKQSTASETPRNIIIEDSYIWNSVDSQKLLVNTGQLPDSQISSDAVKNKKKDRGIAYSESSQHKIKAEASFETLKPCTTIDGGYEHINSWDSSFQNPDLKNLVNTVDTALNDPSESLHGNVEKKQSIKKSETKNLTSNFENEISKKFIRLEIDPINMSRISDPSTVKIASGNEKLNQHELNHLENAGDTRDQKQCVVSQEDSSAVPQNDTIAFEGERKPLRCIRKTVLAGKVLTLINYNQQPYFCTDEFVRSFSKFSGRHVLLKIIDTHGLVLPFLEVNRSDNWEMFEMLDNCELNTMSRKPNGQIHDVLHMVPLTAAADVLMVLKISDVSIYAAVDNEIQNFDPEDSYWYEN